MAFNVGKSIAPPRFIVFAVLLIAGLALAIPRFGFSRGTMMAFDVAAGVFLILISSVLKRSEAAQMRKASQANDANRAVLLLVSVVTSIAVLSAIVNEKLNKADAGVIALVLVSLVLAWLFSNMIYALHYAHLFYGKDDDGSGDAGGLKFPDDDNPDYWDFIYFSFCLGMTFQTSDVNITGKRVRRVVTGQCLAAFVFNLGVLAFTINTIGGGG